MSLNGKYFVKSKHFQDCYLRLDADHFTEWNQGGGGKVNCTESGAAWEYLEINQLVNGHYTIKSTWKGFENIYLRMFAKDKQVNCQVGHGNYEEFIFEHRPDMGGYAIRAANQDGNCWLSMDGSESDGGHGQNGWGEVRSVDRIQAWEIFELIKLPAKPQVDDVHRLINKWAPQVNFFSGDPYRMCTVEYLLQNSILKRDGEKDIPSPTVDQLPKQKVSGAPYWLQINPSAYRGHPEDALVYIHAYSPDVATFVDLQFQFFYALNGAGLVQGRFVLLDGIQVSNFDVDPIGKHDCDWESCMFRIDLVSGNWTAAFLSQHDGGVWYNKWGLGAFERKGSQPIVYSSNHGHATYAQKGFNIDKSFSMDVGPIVGVKFSLLNLCDDRGGSLDGGRRYELVDVSWIGKSFSQYAKWLEYPYRWGRTGGTPYDLSGLRNRILNAENFPKQIPGIDFAVDQIIEHTKQWYPGNLDGPEGPAFKNMWNGDYR